VLVFGPDGRLAASSHADGADPGIASLGDLVERYRQPDGVPVDVSRAGRVVGVPVDRRTSRVLLVVDPLVDTGGRSAGHAVAVIPFRSEEDPQTLQRALGSVLAHELRTPMTTVYGGAELLARAGVSDAVRTEAAMSVVLAAEQLHRVVEDLVLLVRWWADGTEAEPVLVQQLLQAVVERRASQGVAVDVQVEPYLPPVRGNEAFVTHLLRNVIEHAAANSPPGGRVAIAARADEGQVEIRVTDDGPPLGREERERAFDLFAPTARQSADPSGANLSLVVARRLVERLRGTIRAGERADGGELLVRLPTADDADAANPL
jgi:signal transduction histidine kinase